MVKSEAFINLTVAFEAEIQVDVALEDELSLGDNITVRFSGLLITFSNIQSTKPVTFSSCQVTDSNAFPVPTVTLLVRDSDIGLVRVISEDENHSLSVDITLDRKDNGASYLCRSEQTLQTGNETM